jgi:hypothetical protein
MYSVVEMIVVLVGQGGVVALITDKLTGKI